MVKNNYWVGYFKESAFDFRMINSFPTLLEARKSAKSRTVRTGNKHHVIKTYR